MTRATIAVKESLMRQGQREASARACHSDVEEPSFFLELLFRRGALRVGKKPLLEPGNEDLRELEPFCRVERQERHRALGSRDVSIACEGERVEKSSGARGLPLPQLVLVRR